MDAENFRIGDLMSRISLLKMLNYSLKKKMGATPDFEADFESTANTSLEYHAGDQLHAALWNVVP